MGHLGHEALQHGWTFSLFQASEHPLEAGLQSPTWTPFGNEPSKARQQDQLRRLRECGLVDQMPAERMGDQHPPLGINRPVRLLRSRSVVAAVGVAPDPALRFKDVLPMAPGAGGACPAMHGDDLIHGLPRAATRVLQLPSGKSRRSTRRSLDDPSGTVGGRMAMVSKPCSSSCCWRPRAA